MTRYFKTSKKYFDFINKFKDVYKFEVKILPRSVKVKCKPLT